jgi:hypothetical protein
VHVLSHSATISAIDRQMCQHRRGFITLFVTWSHALTTTTPARSGKHAQAGATFGLVVHWRIYPVIYALPVLLFLPHGGSPYGREPPREDGAAAAQQRVGFMTASLRRLWCLISR